MSTSHIAERAATLPHDQLAQLVAAIYSEVPAARSSIEAGLQQDGGSSDGEGPAHPSSSGQAWLLSLPDAIIHKILADFAKRCGYGDLASVALACKALANHVQSPAVYCETDVSVSHLLENGGDFSGDLAPIFTMFSHPRFACLRFLRLHGLCNVSTKMINRATYRAALPQPTWTRLEHLWMRHSGVNATILHVISVLPPTLRSLSCNRAGNWIRPRTLGLLADRCPGLEALDLGWSKVGEPWTACLDILVARLPNLLALDLTYAGYGECAGEPFEAAEQFEALLHRVCKLRQLRYLDLSFMGLNGSSSHKGTRSNPDVLLSAVAQLPALRWLMYRYSGGNVQDQLASNLFSTTLGQRFPAVNSDAALKVLERSLQTDTRYPATRYTTAAARKGNSTQYSMCMLAVNGNLKAADAAGNTSEPCG
jgi:hypothetical protein